MKHAGGKGGWEGEKGKLSFILNSALSTHSKAWGACRVHAVESQHVCFVLHTVLRQRTTLTPHKAHSTAYEAWVPILDLLCLNLMLTLYNSLHCTTQHRITALKHMLVMQCPCTRSSWANLAIVTWQDQTHDSERQEKTALQHTGVPSMT
jgi:hypothetical protein